MLRAPDLGEPPHLGVRVYSGVLAHLDVLAVPKSILGHIATPRFCLAWRKSIFRRILRVLTSGRTEHVFLLGHASYYCNTLCTMYVLHSLGVDQAVVSVVDQEGVQAADLEVEENGDLETRGGGGGDVIPIPGVVM